MMAMCMLLLRFQSTPPARGATCWQRTTTLTPRSPLRFQSTPPARGATRGPSNMWRPLTLFQSTPPARGATSLMKFPLFGIIISIHAPREGGDITQLFINIESLNFNPRPPRGGRRHQQSYHHQYGRISIHAPREGGEDNSNHRFIRIDRFQSTPPARGATFYWCFCLA